MSRLADLLNPAPSSARQSPAVEPLDTTTTAAPASPPLPSLASPLEGLALASSSSTTLGAPPPARSASPSHALDAKTPRDASTMATPPEPVVKEEAAPALDPVPRDNDDDLDDVSMIDAVVKQEPSDAPANLQENLPAKTEADALPSIKPEPSQAGDGVTSPPSASVLPTTEKAKPTPKAAPKRPAAAKKAAPRKRKADRASKDGTPASQRSATPASSRANKPNAGKNAPSPARSGADDEDDDDDDDDGDGGVFCICRGPDDHTWMIGCDGECEDWFHGRCVNMHQQDADLVDKYICPNCEKKGIGVTTWKPMCRLDGCRKPARVAGPAPSKYCSDEHGREFMRQRVLQKSHRGEKPAAKKPRRPAEAEPADGTSHRTSEAEGAHQAYLRGGLLAPGELKALTDGVKNAGEFKRLGESVRPLDPGADAAPPAAHGGGAPHDHGPEVAEANEHTCVPEERQHLETVLARAAALRHQLAALRDKDRFLALAKARAAQFAAGLVQTAAETKKKDTGKDICGFDARLSWSDAEFDAWRSSPDGRAALDHGNLGPATAAAPAAPVDGDGDAVMHEAAAAADGELPLCPKRRCERHKTWYKLHQHEIAYDRRECEEALAKLGAEARGIEERAVLRKLNSSSARVNGVAVAA